MSDKTKETLLKVTRNILDNNGIEAISMRKVGSLAGLSRSALYRHFKNKEAILATIVAEDFSKLGESICQLEKIEKEPKQLLIEILKAYYDYAINNSGHYKLMFNTKWDENEYPEVTQNAFNIFKKISSYVSKALANSQIEPEISTQKTAILYSFIHGLVELHFAGHNQAAKGLGNALVLIGQIIEAILK